MSDIFVKLEELDVLDEVPRIDKPSDADFLSMFGEPGLPVVIEGLMANWEAWNILRFDSLAERVGELTVEVGKTIAPAAKREMLMKDFLRYVATTSDEDPYYLSNWRFQHDLPELRGAYSVPNYFYSWLQYLPEEIRPDFKWIFLGPGRTGTGLHTDVMMSSAWNALFVGRKLWIFLPPSEHSGLATGASSAPTSNEWKDYPSTLGQPQFCIQKPGDVVFTPSGWLHQVRNLESSIALTENFVNSTNCDAVMKYLESTGRDAWVKVIRKLQERFR